MENQEDEWICLEFQGDGGNGTVFKAFHQKLRKFYAIKRYNKKNITQNNKKKSERKNPEKEIMNMLLKTNSPYIIKILNVDLIKYI